MSAITDGLPLAYLDAVCIGVADLMHQNADLRDRFGGRTLGGTASITPGDTAMTGTGTGWLDDPDDSLAPGDLLLAGEQLVTVATVTTNTALTIEVPLPPATEPGHVAGLIDEVIHKAATWGRVHFPFEPAQLGMPYWTVAPPGPQPAHQSAVGRKTSAPEVQWTAVYEQGADANLLGPGQASWAALASIAEGVLRADGKSQTLQVARFDVEVAGEDRCVPLVRQLLDTRIELARDPQDFITAAALAISFEGNDPGKPIPQRW